MSNAPAYTMPGRKQNKGNDFIPGPGAYNPDVRMSKENISGIKIGSEKRDQKRMLGSNDNPGPGNYNTSHGLGGPSYMIGSGSRSNLKNDQTPGPGHYKVPFYVA